MTTPETSPSGSVPQLKARSGGGSATWSAVGVYFGHVVVQVFVGIVAFMNAYAEMDPNGQAVSSTITDFLLFSPSLVALGLVIWTIIVMARATRHPVDPDSVVPDLGHQAAPPPSRGSRTRMGVLIGSARFLITCAGPCLGPSLVNLLTSANPTDDVGPIPTATVTP